MYGYIYKFTFLPTNKIYIGKKKGKKFIESYWGSGKCWKREISSFDKSDWNKVIKREILEWTDSEENQIEREKYWIYKLDSTNPEIGYNISIGGTNPILFGENNGMWKHVWTQKQKDNQIKGLKNRDFWDDKNPSRNKETIEKIRKKALKNGCKMTEDGKKRISNFVKSIVHITNGKCNLQCKKEELDYYAELGYYRGVTNNIRSRGNNNFIRITNGIVNHKIPREELDMWLNRGWIRGDRRKESSQRKLSLKENI